MSRHFFLPFVTLILLCRCATQHQPIAFPTHFALRPPQYFSYEALYEIQALEARFSSLTVSEKKRLSDLYQLEAKALKGASPRALEVQARLAKLQPEVQPVEERLKSLREKVLAQKESTEDEKPTNVFQSPALKKEYLVAYQFWNRDQNDLAAKKIDEILLNESLRSNASRAEWFKVLNLRFRIALDLQDWDAAQATYTSLRDWDTCAPETAQAGFLVSLHLFLGGDGAGADKLFTTQCDPDTSPANRIRQMYWKARFLEKTDAETAQRLYEGVLRVPLPNYYYYLSLMRLGLEADLSGAHLAPKSYLTKPWAVRGEVHDLFLRSEEALKARLFRDSQIAVQRARQILLKESPLNLPALLYTAHLAMASAAPLDAMRIFSGLTSFLQNPENDIQGVSFDFVSDLFPRPHGVHVEWLTRQWSVDPDFVLAIMRQESAFNPGAISGSDARGLMQMMPFLARSIAMQWGPATPYAERSLLYARENLKWSVFHMLQLQNIAPNVALMAASYNAGWSRVSGWWKRTPQAPLDVFVELIPVTETRNYVKLVMRNYITYRLMRGRARIADLVPMSLPPLPTTLVP